MNFFERTSQSNILNHAVTLLGDLVLDRETPDERERPIIFVGHSLGGLVIKDALCRSYNYRNSSRQSERAAIQGHTAGIVFLGTPHRGSSHAAWASLVTRLAEVVLKDKNESVIEALKNGSETTQRLQEDFSGFANDIHIRTCLEDLAYSKIGKVTDHRVDSSSSAQG